MPAKGFSRDVIQPLGTITLPITARKGAYTTTTMNDFLVVRASLAYNVILGHPTLNSLKAVTFAYHLKMKFSIETRVGEVGGEQTLALGCYVQELKSGRVDVLIVENQNQGKVVLPQPLVLLDHDMETMDEEACSK